MYILMHVYEQNWPVCIIDMTLGLGLLTIYAFVTVLSSKLKQDVLIVLLVLLNLLELSQDCLPLSFLLLIRELLGLRH